jgi:hypothetical protein
MSVPITPTIWDYTTFGYTSPLPNLTDFTTMLTAEVGVPATAIADASLVPTCSPMACLSYAVHWCYALLDLMDNCIYLRAVYCLATDRLINVGQDPIDGSTTFFSDLRAALKLNSFVPGLISRSADENTDQSFEIPESLSILTLPDLQNMKTPLGREYLGYAQQSAPIWGLS